MKTYKVNEYFAIRCFTDDNGRNHIQVYMHCVPWEEVLEEPVLDGADAANKEFKRLVAKYRGLLK